MKKEMAGIIEENNLSPFSIGKTRINLNGKESIFKTKDARQIFNKTLEKLSSKFIFSETENLWQAFSFTADNEEISKRQEFFSKIEKRDNSFLKLLEKPKNFWKPKYGILAVTEDEKTFSELQKLNVPCQFLNSQYDLEGLDSYDIIQVIDCDNFSQALERLPQSVFLDSLNEVYLERYLEILSGWKKNIEIINANETNREIKEIAIKLAELFPLLENKQEEKITQEQIDKALEAVNSEVEQEISKLNIPGSSLVSMLSKGKLPEEIIRIIEKATGKTGFSHLFKTCMPVALDEQETEKLLKEQDAGEFTSLAENVKKKASELLKIPGELKKLSDLLVYFDFCSGVSQIISENKFFPEIDSELAFSEAENILLDDAQPISFSLDLRNKCSILTGANSGGKTTLLEHVIQLISFLQLGLPVKSKVKMPLFSEIYYFAKNKGASSKGAFENLLSQMATIKPGARTLVLADEIESVTEPGVAGKIISATADFFTQKGCFMIIATHLGQEIQKNMPSCSRIDGIEAKGLDENFELVVDHNPVLGKLASSTPELIIEKMAKVSNEEYFQFLNERVRKTENIR